MQALAQALTGLALPAAPSCSNETKPTGRKIRSQDRAMRWRADLERHFGRVIADARTPAEQADIEDSYKEALDRGPDFSRVRRDATTFGLPKIKGLDRNELARLIFQFEMIERGLWKTDRQAARSHGRKIKRTMPASVLPVLRALVRLTVKYAGRVFPSLEGLAILAQMSRSTCIAAVKLLETWGFLKITRRCKREQTSVGMRLVQDTSMYELHPPQGLAAMAARIFASGSVPVKSGGSSGSENPPASNSKNSSFTEEVRVADRTQPEPSKLELLPSTFETPRRRIHWSEMIKPRH